MKRFEDEAAATGHLQDDRGGATATSADAKPPRLLLKAALAGSLNGAVPSIVVNWLAAGMPGSVTEDVVNLAVTGFAGGFAGAFVVVVTHQRKAREQAASAGEPTARPPLAIPTALVCGLLAGLIGAVFSALVGYSIIGMPGNELVNVLQHGVGGLVTGMFGGFLGLLIHLRHLRSRSLPPHGAVG